MARRRRSHRRSRRGGAQRRKFAKVAKSCWVKLRAGELPRKGDFRKCMKQGL